MAIRTDDCEGRRLSGNQSEWKNDGLGGGRFLRSDLAWRGYRGDREKIHCQQSVSPVHEAILSRRLMHGRETL